MMATSPSSSWRPATTSSKVDVVAYLVGRVRDPRALGRPGDAHGADGALEGDARHHERRRGGVDGQDVVGVLPVDADDRDDDLGLVAVAVGEARPQRAVDEPAGEDGQVGRPALTAEEAAGDAPGGVHALLDVDRQGEEVDALADDRAALAVTSTWVLAQGGDDRALALERQLAGLEREGLVGARDRAPTTTMGSAIGRSPLRRRFARRVWGGGASSQSAAPTGGGTGRLATGS